MVGNFQNEILIIARLLLGGAFVFAGLRNIENRKLVTSLMAARGVPQAALALWLGILLQIVAGAPVIAGLWTALAATALIVFLIVATLMFHRTTRVPIARFVSTGWSAMLLWPADSWR